MRGLKFEGAKLEALESLEQLAPGMTSETILDRVLPYIVRTILSRGTLNKNAQNIIDAGYSLGCLAIYTVH